MSAGPDETPDAPVRPLPAWLRPLREPLSRRRLFGLLASLVTHAALLLALALLGRMTVQRQDVRVLTIVPTTAEAPLAPPPPPPLPPSERFQAIVAPSAQEQELDPVAPIAPPRLPSPPGGPGAAGSSAAELSGRPLREPGVQELLTATGMASGGGYQGRAPQIRARLALEQGGTRESEEAVEKGLAWLAAHQRTDGGWRFDLREAPCGGRCGNSGSIGATTGATAIALLPFLGAGYLPNDPKYGEVVQRGLYYLQNRMLTTPHGGDLQEGTMYAQGLSAVALCEAYAMTRDASLRPTAQKAIDFICHVQHPKGGWRYYPGQPGDTTVFGWQFMALKSAQMGGLFVPSPVIERAKSYLDGVQTEDGAFYGYLKPQQDPTPTAVGLLSRMYSGWLQRDRRLDRGIGYLVKLGPSKTDMYFNYYATQVVHHSGSSLWFEWNRRMREFLISSQSRNGHESGSWHFTDPHGTVGGRLYTTAICVMILEVYYRHMPLYGEQSLEGF